MERTMTASQIIDCLEELQLQVNQRAFLADKKAYANNRKGNTRYQKWRKIEEILGDLQYMVPK